MNKLCDKDIMTEEARKALEKRETKLSKEWGERMGRFEISKDVKGEYRFVLKAGNGKIICVSEGYKTMKGCKNGIESIMANARFAEVVVL